MLIDAAWMNGLPCLILCVCERTCTSTTFDWISQRTTSTLSAPPPPTNGLCYWSGTAQFPLCVHICLMLRSQTGRSDSFLFMVSLKPVFWTFWDFCPSSLTISTFSCIYTPFFLRWSRSAGISIHTPFHRGSIIFGSMVPVACWLILRLHCKWF